MNVLLVDDDALFRQAWQAFASAWRHTDGRGLLHLRAVSSLADALVALASHAFDAILLDVSLAHGEEGLGAIASLRATSRAPIVMHSVRHDHDIIVRAMRAGAHDYLPKHLGFEAACEALWQLRDEVMEHAPSFAADSDSPAMQQLAADIAVAKRSHGNVLIGGEPGSGKERVAKAFAPARGPFVAIDASTLDESLASGLLFGATRGAYTGADRDRPGLIEQADGGTLFLDEVGNLPLAVQAKLLRVLQERQTTRLGSAKTRRVHFRTVTATHNDLASAAQTGSFRYDLYTRLAVFVLHVPPLRARKEDIPRLFAQFLREAGEGETRLRAQVARDLGDRPWWGNVRELEHVAHVARARALDGWVELAHLPAPLAPPRGAGEAHRAAWPQAPAANEDREPPFRQWRREQEKEALEAAYRAAGGNISRMARQLGLDRSRLHVKLRHYGIHASRGQT